MKTPVGVGCVPKGTLNPTLFEFWRSTEISLFGIFLTKMFEPKKKSIMLERTFPLNRVIWHFFNKNVWTKKSQFIMSERTFPLNCVLIFFYILKSLCKANLPLKLCSHFCFTFWNHCANLPLKMCSHFLKIWNHCANLPLKMCSHFLKFWNHCA